MWVWFARTGDSSLARERSPDGRDHMWPLYDQGNKWRMVFDEFNIRPEKDSERQIRDHVY